MKAALAPSGGAAADQAPVETAKAKAPAEPIAAQEATAQLQANAYTAQFVAPGRITLASDGAQKSFALGRLVAQPTLSVKTAPAIDPTAYVEAHFVDAEDAPILPGQVALLRDGAFVGLSQIGFVAPGDGVDLGFGGDDKVKVQRAPVNRKENEPTWYNQTKIETREFTTSVKNLHAFPIKVAGHRPDAGVGEYRHLGRSFAADDAADGKAGRRQARGDELDARPQAGRIEGDPPRLSSEMAGRSRHHDRRRAAAAGRALIGARLSASSDVVERPAPGGEGEGAPPAQRGGGQQGFLDPAARRGAARGFASGGGAGAARRRRRARVENGLMAGARLRRLADHRRRHQRRRRRVEGVSQPRQRADAAVIGAVLQIARRQDAHGDVARRAERGERDRERFAQGSRAMRRASSSGARQRLGEGAGEAFGFAAEREALEPRDRLRGVARPMRRSRRRQRGALSGEHDLGAPTEVGFQEQRRFVEPRRAAPEQRLGQPGVQGSLDPLFGAAGEQRVEPRIDRRAAVSRQRDEDFDFAVVGEKRHEFGVEVVAPGDGAGARIVARGGGEKPFARQGDRALQNVERGLAAHRFERRRHLDRLG